MNEFNECVHEGSKTLMHVFDSFDDKSLILELLTGDIFKNYYYVT